MKIERQDIAKTALIVWLMAATGYVLFDLYDGYKTKGIQAAYQQGYADSVDQVISKVKEGNCQPIEIRKGDRTVNVLDAGCQSQPSDQAAAGLSPRKE